MQSSYSMQGNAQLPAFAPPPSPPAGGGNMYDDGGHTDRSPSL